MKNECFSEKMSNNNFSLGNSINVFGKSLSVNNTIIWIDSKVGNYENKTYLDEINNDIELSKYKKYCFTNVEDGFNHILSIDFEAVFIIVSGSLYSQYYNKLVSSINLLKCLPITIIFTSSSFEKVLKNKIPSNGLTKEVLNSISHPFYNLGGVYSLFSPCFNFIFDFHSKLKTIFNKKEFTSNYEGCLTFEPISEITQLLMPSMIQSIIQKDIITENEVSNFIKFILEKHGDEEIVNLIHPELYIKNIPLEILSKFWARVYTLNSSFYSELNKMLMKKQGDLYSTFVKMMYTGLKIKSLKYSEVPILYRGTRMQKKEIDNVIKSFKEKKNYGLPKIILYSRCFLSFSRNKFTAQQFIKAPNFEQYSVFFELKNDITNNSSNYASNADLEDLSYYKEESEVLFFPFSSFSISNITEEIIGGNNCIYISLEYLGRYRQQIESAKKNEKIMSKFYGNLMHQNFCKQFINSKIIKKEDKNEVEIVFQKAKEIIEFDYGINLPKQNENNIFLYQNAFDIKEDVPNYNKESKQIEMCQNFGNSFINPKNENNNNIFYPLINLNLNNSIEFDNNRDDSDNEINNDINYTNSYCIKSNIDSKEVSKNIYKKTILENKIDIEPPSLHYNSDESENARKKMLDERERILNIREQNLILREKNLNLREENFILKETTFFEKEKYLNQKEKDYLTKKENIDKQEENLKQKKNDLIEMEKNLEEKIKQLQQIQMSINGIQNNTKKK